MIDAETLRWRMNLRILVASLLFTLNGGCDDDATDGDADVDGDSDADSDGDGDVDADGDGDGDADSDGDADGDTDSDADSVPPVLDRRTCVPESARSHFSRFVNYRPADNEQVDLNPPRMSWRYGATDWTAGIHIFTLQIDDSPDISSPVVDVVTPYNFYNTLPALNGDGPWYWRVGYDVGSTSETWSEIRSFTIAPDAVEWDREGLAYPDFAGIGHPRILFTSDSLEEIRSLASSHPASQDALDDMVNDADDILGEQWWSDFPSTDTNASTEPYYQIARGLALVAFVYVLTEDPRYEGVVQRAVTYASWPRGGYSSPEGAGGDSSEDSTQANEYLALLFDWLYPVLSSAERDIFVESLEWRVDYIYHEFAWMRDGEVRSSGLSAQCSSHPYEASMDTAVACLALYEHSVLGQECFDLMVNYMIGVTSGMGYDEAWNEGPGYGNSKMKWLMNATLYFATALPDSHLERNPFYRSIGDFFSRITPVGLPHSPWGNGSANDGYYTGGRRANFRRLAHVTGEGRFLRNWRESGGNLYSSFRPWIGYALPYHFAEPAEALEDENVRLFPVAGWVTAASGPPSSAETFEDGLGIIFQARPRGGYSHSFNSDNSFQLHAYGQQLNHGGGSTVNLDAFAYHTMSHTTLLIDGLGQAQPGSGAPLHSTYSRVIAFEHGVDPVSDVPFVFFAGDATNAYPESPGDYSRWALPLDEVYEERALGYLDRFIRHVLFVRDRYYVVFDDVETEQPATFTWLYHILDDAPFDFSSEDFTVRYGAGDVQVILSHIAHRDDLELDDRRGLDAMVNPMTGEDYRDLRRDGPEPSHNLWISNQTPASSFNFLTVIVPYLSGEIEPRITRIDDVTVEIEAEPGIVDTIHFGSPRPENATISVDIQDIAEGC